MYIQAIVRNKKKHTQKNNILVNLNVL